MDKWLIFGLLGQGVFSARFAVQWIASEIKKKSHIPEVFWYLSILGGLMLFAYAIHRKDPVFIIGQGAGIFVYTRNIILIKRNRPQEADVEG